MSAAAVTLSTVLAWLNGQIDQQDGHEIVIGAGVAEEGAVVVFLPGGNFPEPDGAGADLEAALVDCYRKAQQSAVGDRHSALAQPDGEP